MSERTLFSARIQLNQEWPRRDLGQHNLGHVSSGGQSLAAAITQAASQQTYYTIRFLVDRERIPDAYRGYAYFRWLDDQLDQGGMNGPDRLALVERQMALVERCYRGESPHGLSAEERMLADLIRSDHEKNSGLQAYIRNMAAVMAFDANRRGRLISRGELTEYSRLLAAAVTEALHYFIGHDCRPPRSQARYLAATGAHVAHMLRDTYDDNTAGYFNIPREYLEAHRIGPQDVASDAYRAWVQGRVRLAQTCLAAGKGYLAQVRNWRCRLAGHAYISRFEGVLEAIEQEGYQLRAAYPDCKNASYLTRLGGAALSRSLKRGYPGPESGLARFGGWPNRSGEDR